MSTNDTRVTPGRRSGRPPRAWRHLSSSGPTPPPRRARPSITPASAPSGMAGADIGSLTASKHVKLVAVADVDLTERRSVKKRFPDVKVYQDWRELLDKEKHLDSVNVSTPDHMHAPITMRAHAARAARLQPEAADADDLRGPPADARSRSEKKLVTQMGIQIHSHEVHRTVVATIQAGAIGKVKEVHSWSGKHWGDRSPGPTATTRCRPASTGTSGSAWPPSGRSSARLLSPRRTGGSGSTSAPARSATWAATSSTRCSRRWR